MSETAHTPMASLAFMPLKAVQVIDGFNLIDAEGGHYGHISTGANLDLSKAIINAANAHDDMLAALKAAVHPKCIGFATAAQQYFRDNDASRKAIAAIRAAIAKAEART